MARKDELEDDEIIELDEPSDELEEEEEDRGDAYDEEDSDEEEEEDLEEEEEEFEPPKNLKIPKARLDEVIKQREEAKERNRWLEEQITALINKQNEPVKEEKKLPEYDFATSEEQYATLLIEGDFAKAAKLRLEIDAAKRAEILSLIDSVKDGAISKAKSESSAAIEADRFTNLVSAMEIKYPFLNNKHERYNEEAVDTVNTLMSGYQAAGKSKSEALTLAVAKVTSMFKEELGKKSLGKERTEAAGKKAAKAAKAQPVKTKSSSSINRDTDKVDVTKMSDREFNKLTDKEKRILRGDF